MSFVPLVFMCCCALSYGASRTAMTVTNEDIRDAILQVVHAVRTTEDKLERHEYRERVLGENLKKAVISIDKRIKMLDPFKGTVSRIDERLATVETILMQREERERVQSEKIFSAIEDIQKNLPQIVDRLKEDIMQKLSTQQKPIPMPNVVTKEDFMKLEREMMDKLNNVAGSINRMENEVKQIKEENKKIRDINNNSATNMEKVKRQLDTSEELLEKYENKLAEYNNRIPPPPPTDKEPDWRTNFQQALEVQKSHVAQILSDVKGISSRVNKLPDKTDLASAKNATLDSIAELKQENVNPKDIEEILDKKFNEIETEYQKTKDSILESVKEMSEITESLTGNMAKGYDQLTTEIQKLAKGEEMLVQTADSVLDTKRRVEYGVQQIISEVSTLIKASTKDITLALDERFDEFETTVLDEDNGALANFTSKLGEEIDQVWRQIGIMHQQFTETSDTLLKLQNQTDIYVNGSLNIMDSVQDKVGKITQRMNEVDENLNYLIGRLSLVTQEFNKIKTGLGKALDELKGSFKQIEDRIPEDDGKPRKIKLSSNEVYTQ